MALIPWRHKRREEPGELASMSDFRSEMERLFESYFREPFERMGRSVGALAPWSPSLDVAENDKEVTVRAEVPGIEPQDLDIQVTGNQLILSGEKKESFETREEDYYHSERRFGTFRRVVPLPAGVDADNVTADYDRGVLTIRMPKLAGVKPKQIQVRTSSGTEGASQQQPQPQQTGGDGNAAG